MAFAAGLRDSLQSRHTLVPVELSRGEGLRSVLSKHLLAVEEMSDGDLIASILLLSADGRRLSHGAAPRLPQSYCEALDGSEIGPSAGSCGTAAYFDRPVYVRDIATDPLWADYRHLALPHGLRSCWSTPIHDPDDRVIGTFAIYRHTVGDPSGDELDAIEMITDHVARAILMSRDTECDEPPSQDTRPAFPRLRLVHTNEQPMADPAACVRLRELAETLRLKAAELDRLAADQTSRHAAAALRRAAELSMSLVEAIRSERR